MSSVNKVIIVGNLGKDPEVRYTQSGAAVTSFSVATSEKWKDKKTGQLQEETEWHKVTVFGNQAESCGKYLAKGRKVYIEGKVKTDKWTDKDGNDRYSTGIVARDVVFLSSASEATPNMGAPAAYEKAQSPAFSDEDIPF